MPSPPLFAPPQPFLDLKIDFLSEFSTRYGRLRKYGQSLDYSGDIKFDFISIVEAMGGANATYGFNHINHSPIRECVKELYERTIEFNPAYLATDMKGHAKFIFEPLLLPLTLSVYHDVIAERIDFRYALRNLSEEIAFLYGLRVPSECGDSPQIPDFEFQVLDHSSDVKGDFYLRTAPPRKGHCCRSYTLLQPDTKNPPELSVLYYGQSQIDHSGMQMIGEMIDLDFKDSEIEKRLEDWNKRGFILDLNEQYGYVWQCSDYLRAVLRYHDQSAEKPFFIYEWLFPVTVGSRKSSRKSRVLVMIFYAKIFKLDGSPLRIEVRSVLSEVMCWTSVIGLWLGIATVLVFLCGSGLNIPLLSFAAFFCVVSLATWMVDGFVTHMLLSDYDNNKEAIPGFELFDISKLQLLSSTVDALYGATDTERLMSTVRVVMGCTTLALLMSAFLVAFLTTSGMASVCIMISYVAAGCFALTILACVFELVAGERRISLFRSLQQMPAPFIKESAVPDDNPVGKAQVKFLWQMWNVHQGHAPDGGVLETAIACGGECAYQSGSLTSTCRILTGYRA